MWRSSNSSNVEELFDNIIERYTPNRIPPTQHKIGTVQFTNFSDKISDNLLHSTVGARDDAAVIIIGASELE